MARGVPRRSWRLPGRVPDIAGVSLTAKQAATQKHKSTVASQYNTYSGNSYTLNASTVFDDAVTFTTRRMNIYSYPVIGHLVCPAASPGCPDDCVAGPSPCPELPLHVQFSGVDNVGSAGPITHLNCVEIATGKRVWQQTRYGKGNLIAADGKLWISTMEGELVAALASPEKYQEIGRAAVLGKTRQAPALSDGMLYLRDDEQIVCLTVRAEK